MSSWVTSRLCKSRNRRRAAGVSPSSPSSPRISRAHWSAMAMKGLGRGFSSFFSFTSNPEASISARAFFQRAK